MRLAGPTSPLARGAALPSQAAQKPGGRPAAVPRRLRRLAETGGPGRAGKTGERPAAVPASATGRSRRDGPGGGPEADMQASGRADGWRPDGAAGAACMRMEHDRPRILLTRILLTRMGRRSTYGSTLR